MLAGELRHCKVPGILYLLLPYLCVHMHVYAHICVCFYMGGYTCTVCGDQRATLGVIPRDRTGSFETASVIDLELTK